MEGKLLRSATLFAKQVVGKPMGFEFSAFLMKRKLIWIDYLMFVGLALVWAMCIPYAMSELWILLALEAILASCYTAYVVIRMRQLNDR